MTTCPTLHYLPTQNLQSILSKAIEYHPELVAAIEQEYKQFSGWQVNGAILDVFPNFVQYLYILERLTVSQVCKSWKDIIEQSYSWVGELYAANVSPEWLKVKSKFYKLFTRVTKVVVSDASKVDLSAFPQITEFENFNRHYNSGYGFADINASICSQLTRLLLNGRLFVKNGNPVFSNLTTLSCVWFIDLHFYDSTKHKMSSLVFPDALFPQLKSLTWAYDQNGDERNLVIDTCNKINEFWKTNCIMLSNLTITDPFMDNGLPNIKELFPFLVELFVEEDAVLSIKKDQLPSSINSVTADFTNMSVFVGDREEFENEDHDPDAINIEIFASNIKDLPFLQKTIVCMDFHYLPWIGDIKITHCFLNGENYEDEEENDFEFGFHNLKFKELVITLPHLLQLLKLYNNYNIFTNDMTTEDIIMNGLNGADLTENAHIALEHLIILPTTVDYMQNHCNRLPTLHQNFLRETDTLQCLAPYADVDFDLPKLIKVDKITCAISFANNTDQLSIFTDLISQVTTCTAENLVYNLNPNIEQYRVRVPPRCF